MNGILEEIRLRNGKFIVRTVLMRFTQIERNHFFSKYKAYFQDFTSIFKLSTNFDFLLVTFAKIFENLI